MQKPYVYKKRKYTPKTTTIVKAQPIKTYSKKDPVNRWAPKLSDKEYKYFDNLIAPVTITTVNLAGQISWLNQTGIGGWTVNRQGNRIMMKSIHLKGILTITGAPPNVPSVPNVIRLALVYDKSPNGVAAPAIIQDVFQSMSYSGTTETSVFSGVNISNRDRFIVLRDYLRLTPRVDYAQDGTTPTYHGFTGQGSGGMGSEKSGQTFQIDEYIKLNLPAVYKVNSTQTNNDYSNIETGALLLYQYCGGQSGNWVFTHSSRVVFKEENIN